MPRLRGPRLLLACVAMAVSVLLAAGATPAQAASAWPEAPSGIVVADVTHTSFVFALARAANTDAYKLWVSADVHDMWVANLRTSSSTRRSYSSGTPRFSVTGLTYRAASYYVRTATAKGSNLRYGPIMTVDLRPSVPALAATSTTHGLWLGWGDQAVTSYVIERALDPGFTTGVVTFGFRGRTKQFTPSGLAPGTQYWFRARAVNGKVRSAWSPAVARTPVVDDVRIRVVTYNLLGMWADGTRGGTNGEVVKPWMTYRRTAAADLVRPAAPDIVLVQEASSSTNGWMSPWQVDTFASTLGSSWSVADTNPRELDPGYVRPGVHVIYRKTTMTTAGTGGIWAIGNGHWAAFQPLRHKATGAEVLAVSVHTTTTSGAASDAKKADEVTTLLSRIANWRTAHGPVPVVWGGDVGSVLAHWHPYDPPGVLARGASHVDAFYAAPTRTNTVYSSYNGYSRTPQKNTGSYDRVFASPGVAVKAWNELLHLSNGQFVGTIPSDHNPVAVDLTLPYDVS